MRNLQLILLCKNLWVLLGASIIILHHPSNAFSIQRESSARTISLVPTYLPQKSFKRSLLPYRRPTRSALAAGSTSSDVATSDPHAELKETLVHQFVSLVEESIRDQTFSSLVLRGVSKPKKKKSSEKASQMSDSSTLGSTANELRGVIRQVQGRLIIPTSPKKGQKKQNDDEAEVMLQLTWKYHGATDICKNLAVNEISEILPKLILEAPLASEWGAEAIDKNPIQGAELQTLNQVVDLQLAGNKKPKLTSRSSNKTNAQTPTAHDREKQVPLSKKADFLQALGLTDADGKPKQGMKSKLRQCQKFVEIVGRLVDNQIMMEGQDQKRPISVVDMGCGRGYLTFSLHSYLAQQYPSVLSRGIDVRPKLVEEISGIARSLGEDFDGLTFEEGTIEQFVAEAERSSKKNGDKDDELRVLIALHACDTATDDAIWSGICSGASLLIVAPCCHKQIRPQLNAHYVAESQTHPLSEVLKHGVYRERMSETITDSLRALLLEVAGYKVQVFEFIGGEHTSKNVMITAVKTDSPSTKEEMDSILNRIQSLAEFGGIQQQKLADWMDIDLGGGVASKAKTQLRMPHQMPPLQR